jgi:hypothetical protein
METGYLSLTDKGLRMIGNAFPHYRAWYNAQNVYRGLRLRPVYGTISIGTVKPYIHTGDPYAIGKLTEEFFTTLPLPQMHTWLEDEKGRVYDYITEVMVEFAERHTKTFQFKANVPIEKMTKNECRHRGLVYSASRKQHQIGAIMSRHFAFEYEYKIHRLMIEYNKAQASDESKVIISW